VVCLKDELTDQQVLEILKHYDPKLYEHYMENAWYFGWEAKRYALYLLKTKGPIENTFSTEEST